MSNIGNKGRFSERLKKIISFRKKSLSHDGVDVKKIQDSNKIYMNFLKVSAAIPGLVYDNLVINKSNNHEDNKKNDIGNGFHNIPVKEENAVEARKLKRKIISGINLDEIKTKQAFFYKNRNNLNGNSLKSSSVSNNELESLNYIDEVSRTKELEKSIINLIKKDLIKIVNEFEILQSELYILSEVNGESKVLKDCQKELNQVKSILCKIDKLKVKYDFLKDNYDFEYLLEIDNNDLVDKIIELKNIFGNNELKAVSEDYKLLDVYKYLYLKIDDLYEKTTEFSEYKKNEEMKLKERDIDFEKLEKDVCNVEDINKNYENFVSSQNILLKEIDGKVSKINSYESVELHLKGFDRLFKNSLKFFGLLMLNPLKGIIPSIATETIITGNLIKNLCKNLEWEKEKKMVYEAIDYSNLINNAISDLDGTSRIVDDTLENIVRLKIRYNEKFKKYQGDFLQYEQIMYKINDMENKIFGNKIKIEMMKKRALDQKRANEKKLVLVKKLNEKENRD